MWGWGWGEAQLLQDVNKILHSESQHKGIGLKEA